MSYGTNLQYIEAIAAYKCALALTDNKLEKMIAKVNLAIAYRMAGQPALSYQILQSIDESILSGQRIAGVLVVKGNTAMVLRKVGAAVKYYTRARKYYINANHHRNAARVTVNLLGAVLADGQFAMFKQLRELLDVNAKNHLTDNESAYLQWLDMISVSLMNKTISPEVGSNTLNLATKLVAGGYKAPVEMILEALGARHLIPLEVQTKSTKTRLRARLERHWCRLN
ncbi:hypothetical protein [Pseudoalteromonas luteoviolacea]|uniref:MalT-like TPR region domain-containing protein n=1 Tax=Pseudoalteromonas luteoviolacea S4054 TaxID=1129367 RepID=A0A0F6AHW2_9GAMM|nr:hypothetical protein [Pseudoalteromonas luteoviolacea]AOT11049.1 hypothetical protein S4054249_24760 [Pseudoalteromonas luteoviolacea]AOT15787.1 hypothetical protein S40542_23750 [Pseudoalteromonas luteoviolacea]AOT20870.1 hypothetical protein S4054_24680 [Pseudoalteromonas luteoviolacea]KKE85753.1 hypothetical protein N479_24675 [Pseudoalteromonas luteoviolacea S4054]KZN71112.1 hypothetical protein N481_19730 [Pseudoalteromonas luteoviolacea S4047-1]